MENYSFYIFCLVAGIVAFLLIKRFVGCLIRSIVLIVLVALLALVYYCYFLPMPLE